jgi:hydrogenase-4 component H
MRILTILSRNALRGPRTRRPHDHVPCPTGFRGAVSHDAARCTGCETCSYVCSPAAITFDETNERFVVWKYFTGQCTFCGRCAEYCPTGAITFHQQAPPVTADTSLHRVTHQVSYQACPRCGRLVIPLPVPVLIGLFGDPLPDEIMAQHQLCERCRARLAGARLKKAFAGEIGEGTA